MKRLFLLFAVVCAVAMAPIVACAQSGATAFYDIKSKALTPVVTTSIGVLKDVLGTKRDITVVGFAGYNTQSRLGVAGVAAGASFSLATNAAIFVGPGLRYEAGRPVSGGLLAGFTYRF